MLLHGGRSLLIFFMLQSKLGQLGQPERQLFCCPAFLRRKMRVSLLHAQAAVSDFKLDDFLVHALVLRFAHSSVSERVHPACGMPSVMQIGRSTYLFTSPTFERRADLRHKDSTG